MNKIRKNIVLPKSIILFLCALMAAFSLVVSLYCGSIAQIDYEILTALRLPRTLAAFTTGGLLALAGTLIQLLLQNPLADPYVLGVSGGAALTTLLMMYFGVYGYTLLTGAWGGSLLTMLLILALSKQHRFQTHSLLLIGIALASGFSAVMSFILILSPDTTLHSMLFWLCGDLNVFQMPVLSMLILSIGSLSCWLLSPTLDILYRGELEAGLLGVRSHFYRFLIFTLTALFTAAAVTLAGTIGFVGLIVPHLARKAAGSQHRLLIPVSVLLGGSLLTVADTIARTAFAPQQIPVGIMLSFLGVPLFVWLIRR